MSAQIIAVIEGPCSSARIGVLELRKEAGATTLTPGIYASEYWQESVQDVKLEVGRIYRITVEEVSE